MKLVLFVMFFGTVLTSCVSSRSESLFPSLATMTPTFSELFQDVTVTAIQPTSTATNTVTIPSFTRTPRPVSTVTPTKTPSPTLDAIGKFHLQFYGLALDYNTDRWQLGEDEIQRGLLQHKSISNYRVREWGPSEVYGDLLKTITLGMITYEIWGWSNPEAGTKRL